MNFDRRRLVYVLLALVTIAVYGQMARHPFIPFDDVVHIYENRQVLNGLTGTNVAWAFGIHGPSQWHPLAWLSHQLDCELFGMYAGGHHLMSLALHVASALLLLRVLAGMTGAFWPSALVAALFALHPLHVESVAWASERRDVLCGFFFMLTLGAYTAYARRGGLGRYLLVMVCFALGLMSKPMLVTVPCLLLLLDVWPLGRLAVDRLLDEPARLAWLVAEKIPLLVLSAISSYLTIRCQQAVGAIPTLDDFSLSTRLANVVLSYAAYLRKMVWPADLAIVYPYRITWVGWQLAASFLLLVAITAAVLTLARRRPYLAVGWFWYLGTLVPVIGLVQVGGQAMADRFTYIPLIGVYVMIAWGGAELLGRWMTSRPARVAVCLGVGLVLAALTVCTWFQVRLWHSSVALFEHAIEHAGPNTFTHSVLGVSYAESGDHRKALDHYQTSIDLNPNFADPYYNRAKSHQALGNYDLALRDYSKAISLQPDRIGYYHERAAVYQKLGNDEAAFHDYATVIARHVDPGAAYYNRAMMHVRLGQYGQAVADFTEVIHIKPDYVDSHLHRGTARRELASQKLAAGDQAGAKQSVELALADYGEALRLNPQHAEAYYQRGVTWRQLGDVDRAISDYSQAIALKPDLADAYVNRGNLYRVKEKHDEALADYNQAIQFNPRMSEAFANRAFFYFFQRRFDEAWADVKEVRRLGGDLPPEFIEALRKDSGRDGSN